MDTDRETATDSRLIELYAGGDKDAISQLIDRYAKRLKDYLRMIVRDDDTANDISQDTFIKAMAQIEDGKYTETGQFLSWILRIAHNQAIDHLRQSNQFVSVDNNDTLFDVFNTRRLSDTTIEEHIVGKQIEEDIKRMVEKLPDEQRDAITMRYFDGLSFKEIADQTDVSINTALGRVRYGLINLRKMAKEYGVVLSA